MNVASAATTNREVPSSDMPFVDFVWDSLGVSLPDDLPEGAITLDGGLSRAGVCAVFYIADGEPSAPSAGFSDLGGLDASLVDAVNYCKDAGIVSGDAGKTTFRPRDVVSRQEVAKMTVNYLGLSVVSASEASSLLSSFSDASEVNTVAGNSNSLHLFVATLVANGILKGINGRISPNTAILFDHFASIYTKSNISAEDNLALLDAGASAYQYALVASGESVETVLSGGGVPMGNESLSVTSRTLSNVSNLPLAANNVTFASFDLTGNANVTVVTLERYGSGDEIDLNNVYLYMGSSEATLQRVTTGKTINSEDQRVSFYVTSAVIGSAVMQVRADISATATASSQHGFRLVRVETATDSFDLNVSGPLFTLSGATVGTATFTNNGSLNDIYIGQKNAQISRFEIRLNSSSSGTFREITLQVKGGVSAADLANFKLYKSGVAEPIAETADAGFNDLVSFIIKGGGLNLAKGETTVYYVTADIVGAQNGETVVVNIDEKTDILIVDNTLSAGMNVTTTGFNTTVTVLGADLVVSFSGPNAGTLASGLNSAVLGIWDVVNNSNGRLQARNWTVRLFNTVNANLLAANNRFTNIRLVILDADGKEMGTMFTSVDINSSAVSAPAAVVVNGVNGFQVTITFNGSYDFTAATSYRVALVANLESTLAASDSLVTLEALANAGGTIDKVRDPNNDVLTSASIKPSTDIAAAVQTNQQLAISVTQSAQLGNPSLAVGEKMKKIFAVNMRAGSGIDVNFSRLNMSVVAGPVTGAGLISNARATFLDAYLEMGGQKVSDIEGLDSLGKFSFDNLEGKLVIAKDTSQDVFLVVTINTSGVVSGGTPYQFQIDANSGVATDGNGRNVNTANVFPANIAGQLVTISLGGVVALNDQAQLRTQYVAQDTANSTMVKALTFKLESANATSQFDDVDVSVDTGVAGINSLLVIALPAATDTLTITQPAGVNGVGAFPAITCTVAFAVAATDADCTDGTANFDIASAAFDTIPELAIGLRTLTSHLFTVSGSGNGVVVTHTAPAVDGNFTMAGTNFGTNFTNTVTQIGQRSGTAAGKLTVTGVPANASTLILGDTVTANICTVTFTAGGPADSSCDGTVAGVAVVDITVNNTAALVATALGQISGVLGYELSTSGLVVSVTGVVPVLATTAFTGTQATITTVNTVPGTAAAPNLANTLLAAASLYADGVKVKDASTITGAVIQFRDLDHDLMPDVPEVFEVRVVPKQVITGGAPAGGNFRLTLRRNAFQVVNNGSMLTAAGQELNPLTGPVTTTNIYEIRRAAPSFETGGNINSDLLSVGTLEMLKFKVNKAGTGTVEIGDGLTGSQFQIKLTKTAAIIITSCEVRDAASTVVATKNSTFSSDAFGTAFANQAAQDAATSAFVTFASTNFASGKRISAGGGVYSVFCTVTGIPTNSSMQAQITEDNINVFVDNDNFTSLVNDSKKFLGLPQTGTARVSTN